MPATIQNSKVYLTADNLGYQAVKAPLPTPPPGMTGMYFVFRAYFNGDEQNTAPGWDHTFAFGLCFNGINPTASSRANFFGIANDPSSSPSRIGTHENWAFGYPEGAGYSYGRDDGGVPADFYTGRASGYLSLGQWRYAPPVFLPSNINLGRKYTGVWVIKKAGNDSVSFSAGFNLNSEVNLGDAVSSLSTSWAWNDIVFSDSSNWRKDGVMNFPSHFIAKLPSSKVGRQLIVEKLDMRYFNSETLS